MRPIAADRPRNSPAARVVKVTASTDVGLYAPAGHPVRDPVGDRPGLSCASTCDDGNRPGERGRHLSLLRVEIIQQRVGRQRSRQGFRHRDTIRALTDDLGLLVQPGSGYANSISAKVVTAETRDSGRNPPLRTRLPVSSRRGPRGVSVPP